MKSRPFGLIAAACLAATTQLAPSTPAFAQGTLPIKFGKTTNYEHESTWFSIDMPTTWKPKDTSKKGEEAIVSFTDPTGNAVIVVDVFPFSQETTQEQMGEMLTNFIGERFKKFNKFDMGDPKANSETRVALAFKYEQVLNKKGYEMYGDSFLELHDGKMMSLMTLLMPAEQYDKNKKSAYALLDSLKVNQHVEIIGTLTQYNNPKKVFSIKVPEDWDVTDNSKSGSVSVVFSNPNGYSFIMVEAFKNTAGTMDADALVADLESYVEDTIGKNVQQYKANDAKSTGDNSASKFVSFVVEEKNGDEIPMSGIVYLDQVGTTLSYLRIVLPTSSVNSNTDVLDEIGSSFKISKNAKF